MTPKEASAYLSQHYTKKDGKSREAIADRIAERYRLFSRGTMERAAMAEFFSRHPREIDEWWNWRLANFKARTKPYWNKAADYISQVLSNTAATVKCGEPLQTYIDQPRYGSYEQDKYPLREFFRQTVLSCMLEDPNAVVLVVPESANLADALIEIEPTCQVYYSHQIWHKSNRALLVRSSPMIYNRIYNELIINQNYPKCPSDTDPFLLVTDAAYWYLVKAGNVWQPVLYYDYSAHEIGALPWQTLGGKLQYHSGVYESFFEAFADIAVEAERSFSDAQVLNKIHGSPWVIMDDLACETCDGNKTLADGSTCTSCKGTGYRPPLIGPSGVIMRARHTALTSESDKNPMVEITPGHLDSIKMQFDLYEKNKAAAVDAINMQHIMEAQSGVAKTIDREPLNAFMLRISNRVYGAMRHVLVVMEGLIHLSPSDRVTPSVVEPTSFETRTETDLDEMLNKAVVSKLPITARVPLFAEWGSRKYSGDPIGKYMFLFLLRYDPYMTLTTDEYDRMLAIGKIDGLENARHLYGQQALLQVRDESGTDEAFMALPYAQLAASVDAIVRTKVPAPPIQIQIPTQP